MSESIIIREYNPSTGDFIGNISTFDIGSTNLGEFSPVRVFDIYIPTVSIISNVKLYIISSPKIIINSSPIDISSDGSAGNGNFGIETSTTFTSRNTLIRFFAGENLPVTIGTRASNISKFIYLNAKMDLSTTDSGTVTYKITLDYS